MVAFPEALCLSWPVGGAALGVERESLPIEAELIVELSPWLVVYNTAHVLSFVSWSANVPENISTGIPVWARWTLEIQEWFVCQHGQNLGRDC